MHSDDDFFRSASSQVHSVNQQQCYFQKGMRRIRVSTSRHVCSALFLKCINSTNLWCGFREPPVRRIHKLPQKDLTVSSAAKVSQPKMLPKMSEEKTDHPVTFITTQNEV